MLYRIYPCHPCHVNIEKCVKIPGKLTADRLIVENTSPIHFRGIHTLLDCCTIAVNRRKSKHNSCNLNAPTLAAG
jgi:hypothetical protein